MFSNEILRLFPRKRIKAVDGMAVTAAIWEESHEYHRQLAVSMPCSSMGPGL